MTHSDKQIYAQIVLDQQDLNLIRKQFKIIRDKVKRRKEAEENLITIIGRKKCLI